MVRTFVACLVAATIAGPVVLSAQQPSPTPAAVEKAQSVVNLNTATATDLEALPGIGAKTAQRIVEYREKNGGFKKVEDLMNVKGIGEKSFLKLKPRLAVTAPKH
jgi:competence protein ComEA